MKTALRKSVYLLLADNNINLIMSYVCELSCNLDVNHINYEQQLTF